MRVLTRIATHVRATPVTAHRVPRGRASDTEPPAVESRQRGLPGDPHHRTDHRRYDNLEEAD
ncbi:MAG TPA: hypothetical protein VJT72_12845 [Pseudonocardiaceae bacterium]|nr:hypothetical protein [Pseudonocardiaceae bacterium]